MSNFKSFWNNLQKAIGVAATPSTNLSDSELRERGFVRCRFCGEAVDYSHRQEHLDDNHPGHNINVSFSKMNVDVAGPIPNSLLADQDLEGEDGSWAEEKTQKGIGGYQTLYEDGNFKLCHYFDDDSYVVSDLKNDTDYKLYSGNDAVSRLKGLMKALGSVQKSQKYADDLSVGDEVINFGSGKKVKVTKIERSTTEDGVLWITTSDGSRLPHDEQDRFDMAKSSVATNDKLVDLKDKAEDADTQEEKEHLADTIKAVQIKRQKATIKTREQEEKTTKSFKTAWSDMQKGIDWKVVDTYKGMNILQGDLGVYMVMRHEEKEFGSIQEARAFIDTLKR